MVGRIGTSEMVLVLAAIMLVAALIYVVIYLLRRSKRF